MPKQFFQSCIFCDSPGVTRQHVFPDWIRKHVPRDRKGNFVNERGGLAIIDGKLVDIPKIVRKRNGDLGSLKLNVLCRSCNGEWASRIESQAKPWLSALINPHDIILSLEAATQLATWMILFAIVAEYDNKELLSVPTAERKRFRQSSSPSDYWTLYVGRRFPGPVLRNLSYYPRPYLAVAEGDRAPELPTAASGQRTIFGIGSMVGVILTGPMKDQQPTLDQIFEGGLQQIWPLQSREIDLRLLFTPILDSNFPETLSAAFTQTFGEVPPWLREYWDVTDAPQEIAPRMRAPLPANLILPA